MAVYADEAAAQNDPAVLVLSTNAWTVVYRLKSAVLINVAALGLTQPESTARTLAQSISDRIQ